MVTPWRPGRVVFPILGALALVACGAEVEPAATSSEQDLKTDDHRALTTDYCIRAGFHDAFCARVGAEAFVVDAQEWERPWMHAMPRDGEGQCEAVEEVQQHLARRGSEIRAVLARPTIERADLEALAESLGRTLHTLQDNCAHEGMTNPQHAWYSLRAFCLHVDEDPDLAPRALDCAANETKLVFRALKEAFRASGKDPASLWEAHDMAAPQPGIAHVCEFLGDWQAFDGKDARWDIRVTAPAFRETFVNALRGDSAARPVCEGRGGNDPSPIAIPSPRPTVTSLSDPTCTPVRLLCDR